jgi:hypothetical protein
MTLTPEQKAKVLDELKMFHGDPPYDDWSNHAAGDGYFGAGLERKYRMTIPELEEAVNYRIMGRVLDIDYATLEKRVLAAHGVDLEGLQEFIDEADTSEERNKRKDLLLGYVYGSVDVERIIVIENGEEKVILRSR